MINPKIKICGISDIEILKQLINLNLDYVGFIFYSKSPRFVNEVFEVRQADMQEEFEAVPFRADSIKIDFKMASMEMEQELEVQELEIERFQEFEMEAEQQEMELEVKKIEMFYMEPEEFFEELELQQQEQKLYNVGVTTYADLNSISSGSNIYLGDTTALRVFGAASNSWKNYWKFSSDT